MTREKWWELVDSNWDKLLPIIEKYHPAYGNKHDALITNPLGEAMNHVLRDIIKLKGPIGPELIRRSRDIVNMYTILHETWVGIPESRPLLPTIDGYNVLVKLLDARITK